jgi:hypothetical protein
MWRAYLLVLRCATQSSYVKLLPARHPPATQRLACGLFEVWHNLISIITHVYTCGSPPSISPSPASPGPPIPCLCPPEMHI